MIKKRLLVLCIDRDNDLYEKADILGPVVGREENLTAATKLILAEPEEPDANTMFEAIKIYDSIKEEYDAQIATVTGDSKLGYAADREISKQLDKILGEFSAESCIFVSDGASDEQIIPIIQSRIKIDSMKVVVMRQAKELEKTYFVILEKLKEPHYARMIFGLPAIFLILYALSEWLGYGWKPFGILLGLYLLAKGFGIEEKIINTFLDFRVSVEKISFVIYLSAIPLFVISLWLGFQEYITITKTISDPVKIAASTIRSILLLLPWAALLILLGKIVDLYNEKRKFEMVRYGLYGISVILLWFILRVASDWVLRDAYFSDFVNAILISILVAFVSIEITKRIRVNIASGINLENKEVISDVGAYLGKIVGVDKKRGIIIVQTAFGQKLNFRFENIINVGDKIVLHY